MNAYTSTFKRNHSHGNDVTKVMNCNLIGHHNDLITCGQLDENDYIYIVL